MKLTDILKGAAAIAGTVNPAIGAAIGLVNQFLPDDEKLPIDATGGQVLVATNKLTPEQRVQVLDHEFEFKIVEIKEGNETLRAMLAADATSTHTTRPYIARHAFHVVAVVTVVIVALWAYGVGAGKTEMVKAVMDGWPFILGVIAPFVLLLRAYFGILQTEHRQRLDAAGGTSTGLGGMISTLINRK